MIRRALRRAVSEYRVRRDPVRFARSLGVRVGDDCRFIATTVTSWGSEPYLITIGDHVTLTAGVRLITHDGAVWPFRRDHPEIDRFGPITIEDDCFLGLGAMVLPGVTIGASSVVGAGAIVHRDVPARSVVAGVPARVVCSIDDYWAKHASSFLHIRGRTEADKRRILLEHFGLSAAEPADR